LPDAAPLVVDASLWGGSPAGRAIDCRSAGEGAAPSAAGWCRSHRRLAAGRNGAAALVPRFACV